MWDRLKQFDWLKVWQKRSPAIGGIILVGAISYAAYIAVSVFSSLEKELKAALIAGSAAVGVALTTNYVQKKREMDFKIRERKIESYQKVFDFLLFFLRSTRNNELSDTESVVSRIHEVNYALLVWGSDLTIKAWQEFFRSMANLEVQTLDRPDLTLHTFILRNKLAELILLIRKDLGHVDKGIDVNTIADTYMPLNFTTEDWRLMDEALRRYSTAASSRS
jgi:hypothetical protein